MNLVLLLAILLQSFALAWSLVLLKRLRDWRLGVLAAMLGLMLARPGMALFQSDTEWASHPLAELPALGVSMLAALSVVGVGQVVLARANGGEESRAIAKEQRAEEALREAAVQRERDRLRQILDSQFGFVCVLTLDGVLLEVNQTPLTLMGTSRADVLGRLFWEVDWLEPDSQAQAQAAIQGAARGETVRGDYVATFVNGGRRDVDAVFRPLLDEAGRVINVVGFGVDITDRKRTQEALAESRGRLEFLSRQLITAQEAERQNLARELHDEIGQDLTAMRILLETCTCSAGPQALGIVTELMEQTRKLSFDLRPPMLDPLGLLPALLWQFERYAAKTKIRVAFQHTGVHRRFASALETAAFRVVQESLTNVARHAGVTEATVHLWADADTMGIQVTDQGRGFDQVAVMAAGRTGGLTGIQERVELLGGEMAIESIPGQGTFLTVHFPLSGTPNCRREDNDHLHRLGG